MRSFLIICLSSLFSAFTLGQDDSTTDSCYFYVPNIVTDVCIYGEGFKFNIVPSCELDSFKLIIYNRWGEIIFESDDPELRWDASDVKKETTYVYKITGRWKNGFVINRSGCVSVID